MHFAKIPFTQSSPVDPAAMVSPDHAKLVKQAQRLVSTTFFGTILQQMRQSPFKTKLTDGGSGGESFVTMLDQHLADKMARGAGNKLVDSIVRKLEAKKAYAKQNPGKDAKDEKPMPANMKFAANALRSAGRANVTPGR